MEDPLNKKYFLWRVLLAWVPWVPTIIGIGYLFVLSRESDVAIFERKLGLYFKTRSISCRARIIRTSHGTDRLSV